jgi:FlaG/FlaF family flagellin (archaellin)
MVAIVVILAATLSVFALGFTDEATQPGPIVGQSSGDLVPQDGSDDGIVRINHVAGDTVQVTNM